MSHYIVQAGLKLQFCLTTPSFNRLWKLCIREISNKAYGFLWPLRIHMALPVVPGYGKPPARGLSPSLYSNGEAPYSVLCPFPSFFHSAEWFPHTLMLRTSDVSFCCCCCWQIFHCVTICSPLTWWQGQMSDWSHWGWYQTFNKIACAWTRTRPAFAVAHTSTNP